MGKKNAVTPKIPQKTTSENSETLYGDNVGGTNDAKQGIIAL